MTTLNKQLYDKKNKAIEQQCKLVIPNKYLKYNCDRTESLNSNEGKSLYLWGTVGVGKSVFAGHISQKYIKDNLKLIVYEDDFSCPQFAEIKWVNYPELISKMRSSFSRNSEDTAWCLAEEIAQCRGLVVLDDFAAETISGFVRDITYYIINHRDLNELQTVITSNVELKNIEERISSRIAGMCEIIKMQGSDRRLSSGVGKD